MLYSRNNFEVADFCATSGVRPEITGIHVTPTETAATDNYSLVEVTVPTSGKNRGAKKKGISSPQPCLKNPDLDNGQLITLL
jgi:hypothetical protein